MKLSKDQIQNLRKNGYIVSELSHNKISDSIYEKMRSMDTAGVFNFVRSVYDDRFIFEQTTNGKTKLFQQVYSVSKDDQVEFKGDPMEVIHKEEFILVDNEINMGVDMEKKQEKIKAIIANAKLPDYTEADLDLLTNMEDSAFDKLFKTHETLLECACREEESKAKLNEKPVKKEEEKSKVIENKKEEVKEEVTLKDLLLKADPETREAWTRIENTAREQKENAVKTILGFKNNTFTEEKLKSFSFDVLENIISFAKSSPNFSANNPAQTKPVKANERQENGLGVPDMPEMKWNKDGTPDFSHLG